MEKQRTTNSAEPTHPRIRVIRNRPDLVQGRHQWYRIENLAPDTAAVHLYDEIGYWGVSAADFVAELKELDVERIDLHINSPGGELFDGLAILNALRTHRAHVTAHIDGLAASAASFIAMAGDRIVMAPNSQMMIHDAMSLCAGNAADFRELADFLDKQSDNIAAIYASRAGGQTRSWRKRMQDETWYSAQEAVDAGLADEVAKVKRQAEPAEQAAAAHWDLSIFRYSSRNEAPAPDLTAEPDEAELEEQPASEETPAEDAPAEPDGPPAEATLDAPAPDPETEPEPPAPLADPDPWAESVAHLTETSPSADDAFERLKEALL